MVHRLVQACELPQSSLLSVALGSTWPHHSQLIARMCESPATSGQTGQRVCKNSLPILRRKLPRGVKKGTVASRDRRALVDLCQMDSKDNPTRFVCAEYSFSDATKDKRKMGSHRVPSSAS